MHTHRSLHKAFLAATLLAPLAVGGCGGQAPKVEGPPAHKGIYTTGADCANSGKISYEACSIAIQQAVTVHEAKAPSYSELRFCTAKEGDGKCESAGGGRYRAKLMAFLVTGSTPPTAIPLYSHAKSEDGFRDLEGKDYMHSNEGLVFSEHAQTLFERNSGKRRSR